MKEFKPILIFLLKFILSGVVLVVLYNFFLHHYHSQNLPDPYSKFIANCTVSTLEIAGFETMQVDDKKNPWVWIGIDGKWASYINEGCNAVSVMIIFISFIIAFSTTWKQTSLYILMGLLVIQTMNILRVAWLNYIFIYHEDYKKIAHDYVFPAIIYGTIVILWIIWVKYFALKTKENE